MCRKLVKALEIREFEEIMKRLIIACVLVGVLLGGGTYLWMNNKKNAGGADEAAMAMMMRGGMAVPVSTVTIRSQQIERTTSLPGRISPSRQSQIRPQVNGIITERLFEEGAEVEKGQQLYQIDDARYKAALNSALADLESVKANVKAIESRERRYKDLVKINAVSQQEYEDVKAQMDQAKASIAVAQAAVDVAKVNLDYTKVYAPISGRIGKSLVTEGALVTANQAQHLSVITQLDPVYVDMQQSGSDIGVLRSLIMNKEEVPVHLIIEGSADSAYPYGGTLKFSEVTVEESTGSIALRAEIPNPDNALLPGLFVRTSLDLGPQEVLLVPQRATVRTPAGGLIVWIVDESNQAQPRGIQISSAYGDNWIVTDGLNEGDNVIVEGYQKVSQGVKVVPSPWGSNAASVSATPDKATPKAASAPQETKTETDVSEDAEDKKQDNPAMDNSGEVMPTEKDVQE